MQKSIAESDILNEYRRGSHSVYKLTYHVIFVTKYRKKVITDEIGDFTKNYAAYLFGRMISEQKNTNVNTLRRGNTKRIASAIHPTTDFIGRGFFARYYKLNNHTYNRI